MTQNSGSHSDEDRVSGETGENRDNIYDLSRRLGALEASVKEDRESLSRKLGGIAAATALILSILTGIFTVFDRIITKPNDDKTTEYNQLKSDIRSMINIQEQASEKSNTESNPQNKTTIIQSANIQVQSLLQDSERLLRLIESDKSKRDLGKFSLGSYDYSVLSEVAYNGGDLNLAMKYADKTIEMSDNFHTKDQAYRAKAMMIYQINGASGLQDAKQAISEGLAALSGRHEWGIAIDQADLYSVLMFIEANSGDCKEAAESGSRSVELISTPDIPPGSRKYILNELSAAFAGQSRCNRSTFPSNVIVALAEATQTGNPALANLAPAATTAPPPSQPNARLTYVCRFRQGPRTGQTQSFEGVPGVTPVPVGTTCGDGQGNFGLAE